MTKPQNEKICLKCKRIIVGAGKATLICPRCAKEGAEVAVPVVGGGILGAVTKYAKPAFEGAVKAVGSIKK